MAERAGLRIEAAAELTGLTTRNIRAYQSLGLLPHPQVEGRVGRYDVGHVARLHAIGRLQAQGFSLAGIKVLFDAHERGASLETVLGIAGPSRTSDFPTGAEPAPAALRLALVPAPLALALGALEQRPAPN
jgi:DNA-binding transcriptional MerR regulator